MRTAIRRENKWKQKIMHQTSFAALLFRWLIWGLGQNWKRRIWMPDPVNFGVCFPETRSFCSWWDLWAITAGRWWVWCNRPGGGAPKELVPEFHPSGLWKHVLSHPRDDWPCCVVSSRGQQRGPAGQQASSVCVCSVCVCVCVCACMCVCVRVCVRTRSLSRVWLFCDLMDCSPPGSSVHGILQARILEWVAISSSRESFRPRDQTCVSSTGKQILYHWATREALGKIEDTQKNERKCGWAGCQ